MPETTPEDMTAINAYLDKIYAEPKNRRFWTMFGTVAGSLVGKVIAETLLLIFG